MDETTPHQAVERAGALIGVGRAQEAIDLLLPVAAGHPDDVMVWLQLAVAQRRTGRYDEAQRCARRALVLAPDWPEAQIQNALSETKHDIGEAARLARSAAASAPDDPRILRLAAAVLETLHLWDEAWVLAMAAVERCPDDRDALMIVGRLCLDAKRYEDAEAWLRRALAQAPDDDRLLNLLGIALEGRKDPEAAAEMYARALSADPRAEHAAHNLARAATTIRDQRGRGWLLGLAAVLLIALVLTPTPAVGVGMVLVIGYFAVYVFVAMSPRDQRSLPAGAAALLRSRQQHRSRMRRASLGEQLLAAGGLSVVIGGAFVASAVAVGDGGGASLVLGIALVLAGIGAIVAGVLHLRRHPLRPRSGRFAERPSPERCRPSPGRSSSERRLWAS